MSARCAPRLSPATAWISSTITVARRAQHLAALLGGEQDVERLGRGDQDVRRLPEHRLPRRLRGVAGAHRDADVRQRRRPPRCARSRIPPSGCCEVLLDVVAERLQRRDVDHGRGVGEAVRRAPRAPARRSPRGTRRASCPSRSARRSACRGRRRWRASRRSCGGVAAAERVAEPAVDERVEAYAGRAGLAALHPRQPSAAASARASPPVRRAKIAYPGGACDHPRVQRAASPSERSPTRDAAAQRTRERGDARRADACARPATRRCSPAAACATCCSDACPRTTTSRPRRRRAWCRSSSRAPSRSGCSSAWCWCSRRASSSRSRPSAATASTSTTAIPWTVQFSDARHDAERRDFTINGMFLDPETDDVHDYVGGRADLAAGIVRAIGDPDGALRRGPAAPAARGALRGALRLRDRARHLERRSGGSRRRSSASRGSGSARRSSRS